MTSTDRLRLILHGAVVLLIGLLCGLPTAVESINETARFWHTAHEALIMIGTLMLAESSVLPVLVLGAREARALQWSLLVMGYGFTTALVLGGVLGATPFEPGATPATFAAFLVAAVGIFGAVMTAILTLWGARAALRTGGGGPTASGIR